VRFARFEQDMALAPEMQGIDGAQPFAAFSQGFYKLQQQGSRVLITDLRLGPGTNYTFSFAGAGCAAK